MIVMKGELLVDAKERIELALAEQGFTAKDWREDDEDGLTAVIGKFEVVEEDEDAGLYQGDEGELTACVVGSIEYRNERVSFSFTAEGYDSGNEVRDFTSIDSVD